MLNASRSVSLFAASIDSLYGEGTFAYWIPPLVLVDKNGPIGRIKPNDAVIFCCRRSEREVQLTRAFVDSDRKSVV